MQALLTLCCKQKYQLTWTVSWLHECHLINTRQLGKFFFKPWYGGGGGDWLPSWLAVPLGEAKIFFKEIEIDCQYHRSMTEIKLNTLDKYLILNLILKLQHFEGMLCWFCSPIIYKLYKLSKNPGSTLDVIMTAHRCRFRWYHWDMVHKIMLVDLLDNVVTEYGYYWEFATWKWN